MRVCVESVCVFVGVQSVRVCGWVESVFARVGGVSVCVESVRECAWSQCVCLWAWS